MAVLKVSSPSSSGSGRKTAPQMKYVAVLAVVATLILIDPNRAESAPKVLMLMPQRSFDAQFFLEKEVSVMIELLKDGGYQTIVSTVDGKAVTTEKMTLGSDVKMSEIDLADYAAVVVPCMGGGDYGATPECVSVLKDADARGMTIAAQNVIELLVPAGLTKNRKISRSPGVVVDRNLITSYNCPYTALGNRKPVDTEELIRKLIDALSS